MKRRLQLAVGVAVSLGFLWLAIQGLELAEVGRALAGASYGWLVPALALYFAGVWVRALRWHQLLLPVASLSGARLFPVVVIGYMANNILPARLGELARCYVLRRRDGVSPSAALGTVLLERVMDGLTMLAFMAATLPLLGFSEFLFRLMLGTAALFGVAGAVLLVMAVRPDLTTALTRAVTRPLPRGVAERLQALVVSFCAGLASLGGLRATLRVFGLSCLAWLLEAGMYYVLMFAFPLRPSFPLAMLTTAVANLGTLIPSSPGYVGVFDFLGRSVLAQFGVPEAAALAYVLVVHAALIVPVSLLGLGYAWREGVLGWITRAGGAPAASSSRADGTAANRGPAPPRGSAPTPGADAVEVGSV